jgi:hypothetical protein
LGAVAVPGRAGSAATTGASGRPDPDEWTALLVRIAVDRRIDFVPMPVAAPVLRW